MLIALNRVASTHPSIEARLAIANYLHSKLLHRTLRTLDGLRVKFPRHALQHIDVLQSTLRGQLVNAVAACVEVGSQQPPRGIKRERTDVSVDSEGEWVSDYAAVSTDESS